MPEWFYLLDVLNPLSLRLLFALGSTGITVIGDKKSRPFKCGRKTWELLVDVMCRGGKRPLLPLLVNFLLLTRPTKHLCKSSRYHISGQVFEKVQPGDYLNPSSELIYCCIWMANRLDGWLIAQTCFWTRQGGNFPSSLSQELRWVIRREIWGKKKKSIPDIFLWWKTCELQGPRPHNIALLSKARSDAGSPMLRWLGQSRSVWWAKRRNSVTSLRRVETTVHCL